MLRIKILQIARHVWRNPIAYAVATAVVIFILCATPGQYIPSANWLELLSFDKFVHALMFYVLSSFIFLAGIKHRRRYLFFVLWFLVCVTYGASIEFMQARYFSNRSSDWKDIVANSFGCIIALLLIKKLGGWFEKEKLT
jgi:VanZ family protein